MYKQKTKVEDGAAEEALGIVFIDRKKTPQI